MKLTLLNITVIASAVALYMTNLLTIPFASDVTFITYGLAGLLVFNILRVNYLYARARHVYTDPLHFQARVSATLGFVGTVIGFFIALHGIDPTTVADVEAIPELVSQMLAGIGTAMATTIVGGIVALILEFYAAVVERGARL